MEFLCKPYTQLRRDVHYSFMPLSAAPPLLVCFRVRGVLQTYGRSPACPCFFPFGLALVAVLLHTDFSWFQEKPRYSTSSRDVGSEPVTAPLDKVHHTCCRCSAQGTRLGAGTVIWVNEGTSAPAAPESLLV